jgi:hypothetical protein
MSIAAGGANIIRRVRQAMVEGTRKNTSELSLGFLGLVGRCVVADLKERSKRRHEQESPNLSILDLCLQQILCGGQRLPGFLLRRSTRSLGDGILNVPLVVIDRGLRSCTRPENTRQLFLLGNALSTFDHARSGFDGTNGLLHRCGGSLKQCIL